MERLTKVGGNHLPPKPAPKPGIYVFYALLSVLLYEIDMFFHGTPVFREGRVIYKNDWRKTS